MEIALKKRAQKPKSSAKDILMAAFAVVQVRGESMLSKPLKINDVVFPAGSKIFFRPDSNAILKTVSSEKPPQRHWNSAIIYLGDADGSCVEINPKKKEASDDNPAEESFTARLRLRGRAKLDAEANKTDTSMYDNTELGERGRRLRPVRDR